MNGIPSPETQGTLQSPSKPALPPRNGSPAMRPPSPQNTDYEVADDSTALLLAGSTPVSAGDGSPEPQVNMRPTPPVPHDGGLMPDNAKVRFTLFTYLHFEPIFEKVGLCSTE